MFAEFCDDCEADVSLSHSTAQRLPSSVTTVGLMSVTFHCATFVGFCDDCGADVSLSHSTVQRLSGSVTTVGLMSPCHIPP
jgi:hypothetical protein